MYGILSANLTNNMPLFEIRPSFSPLIHSILLKNRVRFKEFFNLLEFYFPLLIDFNSISCLFGWFLLKHANEIVANGISTYADNYACFAMKQKVGCHDFIVSKSI